MQTSEPKTKTFPRISRISNAIKTKQTKHAVVEFKQFQFSKLYDDLVITVNFFWRKVYKNHTRSKIQTQRFAVLRDIEIDQP